MPLDNLFNLSSFFLRAKTNTVPTACWRCSYCSIQWVDEQRHFSFLVKRICQTCLPIVRKSCTSYHIW